MTTKRRLNKISHVSSLKSSKQKPVKRLIVSVRDLHRRGACQIYINKFQRDFGYATEITPDVLKKLNELEYPMFFPREHFLNQRQKEWYDERVGENQELYWNYNGKDDLFLWRKLRWNLLFLAYQQ